jgi:hypothetical protein
LYPVEQALEMAIRAAPLATWGEAANPAAAASHAGRVAILGVD